MSLLRLIESQGHELKKHGRDWALRCVFHEDSTASLVVTESKNLYHCFGCGAAGSVIDWVMKTQGVSLPHAVQILKNGNVVGAVTHAYGGATAIEIGLGSSSGFSFGVTPWSHGVPVTNAKK